MLSRMEWVSILQIYLISSRVVQTICTISKRSVTYKCNLRESGKLSPKSVIEIDVAKSSSEKGLLVQVMFDRLARHLGVHRRFDF